MRLLVLRPREGAMATAARLTALGHEPVVAPVLAVEPSGLPPPEGRFDALVLTSRNGLGGFEALGPRHATCPVFAVGGRTAAALARRGRPAVAEPDAGALARTMIRTLPPGRVLLVAGHDRKPEPEASLVAAGFEVVVWTAYRARAVDSLPAALQQALESGGVGAALHYSRRSAEVALALVRQAGLEPRFAALRHLCLSDDVASALVALSARAPEIASHPDEDHLLALIETTGARARVQRVADAKDRMIQPGRACQQPKGDRFA